MFPVKKAEENKFILTAPSEFIPPSLSCCHFVPPPCLRQLQAIAVAAGVRDSGVLVPWGAGVCPMLAAPLLPCPQDSQQLQELHSSKASLELS